MLIIGSRIDFNILKKTVFPFFPLQQRDWSVWMLIPDQHYYEDAEIPTREYQTHPYFG